MLSSTYLCPLMLAQGRSIGEFHVYSIDTDVMVVFYYLPCLQDVNNNILIPFMFIILLLYLFSFSIQKIQDETDQHWNFQRYLLIYEYYSKPPLPTPLILISHMFLILRWIFQRRCSCCVPNENSDLCKYIL